jgi:hypothetical protein
LRVVFGWSDGRADRIALEMFEFGVKKVLSWIKKAQPCP